MSMKIHDIEQGSDEWLAFRLERLTASEAPVMMNASPFMSRNQLLAAKKGWKAASNSAFKEALYQKGHDHEADARAILEVEFLGDIVPLVGSNVISGLDLAASYDGTMDTDPMGLWEHKDWNQTTADNVRNSVLDPLHWIQLEVQMMVAEVEEIMFTVSDGTTDNRESMVYTSQPERRQDIIDAGKQFVIDLDAYEIEAKQEVIPAKPVAKLPIIHCKVEGSKIITNIGSVIPKLEALANQEMLRVLETDQDFTTKAAFNKSVKDTRAKIKQIHATTQGEFKDWAKFAEDVATFDSILQKLQSHGEGQVKTDKAKRKNEIIEQGEAEVLRHGRECTERLSPAAIGDFTPSGMDFEAALKGMSSLDKMRDKVDAEVALIKVKLTNVTDLVCTNLLVLRDLAKDHEFLFNNFRDFINQSTEAFTAIVKTRINEHETAEQQKRDDEREEMRLEEEAKAKHKVDADKAIEQFHIPLMTANLPTTLEEAEKALYDLLQLAPSNAGASVYGDHMGRVAQEYGECKRDLTEYVESITPDPAADAETKADEPAITGFDHASPGGDQAVYQEASPTPEQTGEVLAVTKPNNLTQAKRHSHDPQSDKISAEFNDALGMYCERWYLNDAARSELYKLVNQYL